MKAMNAFTLAMGLLSAISAFAQGTINFANHITGSIDAKVIDFATGEGASGAHNLVAQLYVSATGTDGSFVAVGSPVPFRSDAGKGYVVASTVTTPFPGGSTVFAYMAAWPRDFTPVVDQWGGMWIIRGESNKIQVTLGNPAGIPPASPGDLTGLKGFYVTDHYVLVPEPGALGLASLGGVFFFIRQSRTRLEQTPRLS